MPINNLILRWIIICILAYAYGALVQYVLGYVRDKILLTFSIGGLGIIIGVYILPHFFNIHPILNIGGIPLVASLIGSFIIPGIMWLLRHEGPLFKKSGKTGNGDEI